jgi:hypothetical protein
MARMACISVISNASCPEEPGAVGACDPLSQVRGYEHVHDARKLRRSRASSLVVLTDCAALPNAPAAAADFATAAGTGCVTAAVYDATAAAAAAAWRTLAISLALAVLVVGGAAALALLFQPLDALASVLQSLMVGDYSSAVAPKGSLSVAEAEATREGDYQASAVTTNSITDGFQQLLPAVLRGQTLEQAAEVAAAWVRTRPWADGLSC